MGFQRNVESISRRRFSISTSRATEGPHASAANAEPDVAGYRIVWRETTSPVWQNAVDAGNVTRHTITGLSKDNVIFGVQAYDRDGNLSVPAYPKPYRPPTTQPAAPAK